MNKIKENLEWGPCHVGLAVTIFTKILLEVCVLSGSRYLDGIFLLRASGVLTSQGPLRMTGGGSVTLTSPKGA